MSDRAVATASTTPHDDADHRKKGRRALKGAVGGFFVDMYDVYLPVIALAPAIGYFTPSSATPLEQAIVASGIFVAAIIGRPLGAFIFGPLSDKIGRQKTTVIVAGGFSICTGLMTFMPGFDLIGWWAPTILIALRLLDGLFLGGEYTSANPLAMEYAPREKRGLYGSLLNIGYPTALAFITIVTMVTLHFFPAGNGGSPYAVWGWRIPFLIGFIISSLLFFYYLKAVPESELWKAMDKTESPLKKLFRGQNLKNLGLAFLFSTGAWLTLNGSLGVFTSHFKGMGVGPSTINTAILISTLAGAALFPVIGSLGQKFGRKRVILLIGLANATVAAGAFYLVLNSVGQEASFIALSFLMFLPGLLVWSMISAFILELFPTEVRASGYGIGWSLPSIIPAFYTYYMLGLSNFMPYKYTPIVLIVLGGLLIAFAAYKSTDRRHVRLEDA